MPWSWPRDWATSQKLATAEGVSRTLFLRVGRQVALSDEAVHGLLCHLEEAGDIGDGEDIILARHSYPTGTILGKTCPYSSKIWKIRESVKETSSTRSDPHHDWDGCCADNFSTTADEFWAGRYSGQQPDTILRRLMPVVSTV